MNIVEVINGIFSESFWYVAPIIITLTTALSGVFNQSMNIKKPTVKQLVSWAFASVLSCGAWAFDFISFGEPTWLGVVCLCVVTGLSSNGFYDIAIIKNFINTWFTKKEEQEE